MITWKNDIPYKDGNYKVDLGRMVDIEDVKGGYKIEFNKKEDDEVK